MPLRDSVTVRVPATSANLGSGFDCVGLALNVWNDLTVWATDPDTGKPVTAYRMTVEGEGADTLPTGPDNLVVRGLRLALLEAGYPEDTPLRYHLLNRIPIGAGLGSSSAAIVAGLLAGLALTGHALAVENEEKSLQLAASVEGHVDNLAPCIYGGLQIGVHTGSRWYTTSVSVPSGLQCILFTPDKRQDTEGARAILPRSIDREDAVFNIGRTALLINAFASGQLDDLTLATQDRLHQPQRAGIMPALLPVIAAATAAGAKGSFLSGAGSSIMALTTGRKGDVHGQRAAERRDLDVARAMAAAAAGVGVTGRILVTQPTQMGAHVVAVNGDATAVISGLSIGIDALQRDDALRGYGSGRVGSAAAPAPAPAAAAAPTAPGLPTYLHSAQSCATTAQDTPASSATVSHPLTSTLGALYHSATYISTRDTGSAGGSGTASQLSFAQVVFAGLAPDGGLYVPSGGFPCMPAGFLHDLRPLPYYEVAARVIGLLVGPDQIPAPDLLQLCRDSYGSQWNSPQVAPLVKLPLLDVPTGKPAAAAAPGSIFLAEHFHGPTAAFKDLALQLLGNLFQYLLAKESAATGTSKQLTILGATSGDTGSAAIAGLKGKKGVSVFILHPAGRVAPVQEAQMTSTLDPNVHNIAVAAPSDFDACQAIVKSAFGDAAFKAAHSLSAVNSINWARILAQTVYSFWTYLRWLDATGVPPAASAAAAAAAPLPQLHVVVPTGNFGNALSALYAKRCGLPLATVTAATNANSIVHRWVGGGDYDLRPVLPTLAPSMDISLASNIERYWYHCAGDSAPAVTGLLEELAARKVIAAGSFGTAARAAVAAEMGSAAADDATINATIRTYLHATRYALCPHTACGVHAVGAIPALRGAATATGAATAGVVVFATAHPAKFASTTPALAEAGLYYPAVEGAAAKPVVPISLSAVASLGGDAGVAAVQPALPAQLRGLSARPRVCATLPNDVATVKDYVNTIMTSK